MEEMSPERITLSNFHRSFPLKVFYLSASEVKLEALFVHVSSCPFFTIEMLKHRILDLFIPCSAELPGLLIEPLLSGESCWLLEPLSGSSWLQGYLS